MGISILLVIPIIFICVFLGAFFIARAVGKNSSENSFNSRSQAIMNNANQQATTNQSNYGAVGFNGDSGVKNQIATDVNMSIKYCSTCGNMIHFNAVVCPKCGCAVAPSPLQAQAFDTSSVGLNVLSFFFPVIGIVLYFSYKDEKPIRAKGCKDCALISISISFIFFVLTFILAACVSTFA